jgi:hypothetical protein
MKRLFILIIFTFGMLFNVNSAIYYSQSSGTFFSSTRWNTLRGGGGSQPPISGTYSGANDEWIVQNGHSITNSTFSAFATSSIITIEAGGTITNTGRLHAGSSGSPSNISNFRVYGTYNHNSGTTFIYASTMTIFNGGVVNFNTTGMSITTLNIRSGGVFIHNSGSNALPGTNRNFLNSNNGGNGNGTYEIRNHGASAISAQPSWGNLIINRSGGVVAFSTSQTIAGNLEITAGTLNLSTITTHTTASLSFVGTNQSGGSWGSTASSATRKNNTYFTTGITGIINNTSAVLPINLLSFDGFKNDGYNTLYWSTASEFNNDFFTIEKTTDGNTYNIVGIVNGSGDSQILNNYELQDFNLEKTINYYRLKQTDYNGKYKYSDIISIDNRDKLSPTLIKVSNTLGQEVNDYTDGVYMFYYDDGSMVRRFVK